ncbi:DUF998 domain-containing protein [Curtobacterium sp. Leaf261]|uniref:DUF998 domain-containing protein n=1 Tax=Curtobacterium sp. Leaf261 TaxID=1736311 RepID=UPI0006FED8C6|nr:DUF998 domain-containing protein [Curtobacterium sp. Leaf261]KQO64100.1 hypothetical protein ASF23_17400 [Curtobacterium sp. Leaf261]
MTPSPRSTDPLRRSLALTGCWAAALGIALIWFARSRVDRPVYVSELGADGEPTAALFEVALLLVVAAGACVAWAGRGIRSSLPALRAWSVSTSIGAASVLFLVASQVPCTAGCPLPVGSAATVQDAVHTSAAVVGFGAACVAMLQAACASGRRALRLLSSVCGVAVAGIAATGGLLSVAGVATDVGGWLELIATSIAISWLMVFGATSAFEAGRWAGAGAPVRRRRTTADTSA